MKLIVTLESRQNFKAIKVMPSRSFFLDAKQYSRIWNDIIRKLLRKSTDQDFAVILETNIVIMGEDLHALIEKKIKNREYKVLAQKKSPPEKVRVNLEEYGLSESQYLLSVNLDQLEFLVTTLHDKDALQILITRGKVEPEEITPFLDGPIEISSGSKILNYRIKFNGIHIGLHIDVFYDDEAMHDILSTLQAQGVHLIKRES
ncbi:MAG: hypothetical protein AB1515_02895 [Nitrospirota bacterium]